MIESEQGAVTKDPGGRTAILLVYPNSYRLGMSNLGFQTVYRLLNERDDTLCERAFLPQGVELRDYLKSGAKLLSLESGRPAGEFDIIAFSVSFEEDYSNIPLFLDLSGMERRAALRPEGSPLVMAGGAAVSLNPEPVSFFVDFVVVGDAEAGLHSIIDLCRDAAPQREGLMRQLSLLDGVYVPSLYSFTTVRLLKR